MLCLHCKIDPLLEVNHCLEKLRELDQYMPYCDLHMRLQESNHLFKLHLPLSLLHQNLLILHFPLIDLKQYFLEDLLLPEYVDVEIPRSVFKHIYQSIDVCFQIDLLVPRDK